MKNQIKKFKSWVLNYGYAIDSMSVMWYFNQRGKVTDVPLLGIYVLIQNKPYWLEDIADKFIEGAKC